jgi:hypothetical protein
VPPLRHGTATARLCVVKEKRRENKKEGREIEKMNYPFFRNCDL